MISLAGTLTFAALFGSSQMFPVAPRERERAYWETVDQYIHGDRSKALGDIVTWSGKDLELLASSVSAMVKSAQKCTACQARSRFDALPLRAAILLHAERDRIDRTVAAMANDGNPDCMIGPHGTMSERLMKFALAQPGHPDFVTRFYAAMALHYRALLCFPSAQQLAESGLKARPKEPVLHFALGLVHEDNGVIGDARALTLADRDAYGRMVADSESVMRQRLLILARNEFEKTLIVDPSFWEARLRLGRVQWRLGRLAESRAALERALAEARGPALYLAHLFLGRVLEGMGDLEGAMKEYAEALALEPGAQNGAMALAHVLTLRGEVERAREVLEPVLALAGRRKKVDAYWQYLFGTPELAETLLADLRAETLR